MKIAFVVHDFSRGVGHGRYVVELATRFSRDHEVHIFANTADRADADGLEVHTVPAIRANALTTVLSFPLPATLRLGHRWDIVHAQGVTSARFNVITAHICNAGWARAQRTANVARTWRQRVFERVVTSVERTVYQRSRNAQVIAISSRLRDELAEHYQRSIGVSVIHHGVDTALFTPASPGERDAARRAMPLRGDGPIALFVGDLRKGGALALDVLARVKGIRLLMISRSDPSPYAERAVALGLADRVAFHPPVKDIQRYYGIADAFLFPSPYDAFGMVVSEAMACALPVITSRQAGASELITHGHDGFIVDDASDAEGFATHLRELGSDADLRATVGRAARRTAERHSWDDVARETMQIYQRVAPMR